jgi:terminase small subunit-like protein
MARPSEYTEEQAIEICSRIAEGQSLVAICRDDGLPDVRTVYRWLAAREEFCQMYTRAREDQADTLADQIIDIADTPVAGIKTKTDGDGKVETIEGDMIEHRRLQVEARKWIAAKLKPKKYGERVQNEHTGANGGPLVITHTDAEL